MNTAALGSSSIERLTARTGKPAGLLVAALALSRLAAGRQPAGPDLPRR